MGITGSVLIIGKSRAPKRGSGDVVLRINYERFPKCKFIENVDATTPLFDK